VISVIRELRVWKPYTWRVIIWGRADEGRTWTREQAMRAALQAERRLT
jgi:hypothetical protein